jgi:hypothetical protein
MGVITSCLDILSTIATPEVIEQHNTDGSKTVTKRRNPWITGTLIVSVTTILLVYMDGGNGLLSNMIRRKSIEG